MSNYQENMLINKTKEYDSFKFLNFNRNTCPSHVEKLKASFSQSYDLHLHPIIVNADMEIVDGQNRFTAAKEMGLEIYYVIDDNFDASKLQRINTTQKTWAPEDYLKCWSELGKSEYLKLSEFTKDLGFSLNISLKWLGIIGAKEFNWFKNGTYKFEIDDNTIKAISNCKKLIDFILKTKVRKFSTMVKQTAFHMACKKFFMSPIVIDERFFERLDKIPFEIKYSSNWQTYFDQFVEIYNWDIKKHRIKVLADGDRREITT